MKVLLIVLLSILPLLAQFTPDQVGNGHLQWWIESDRLANYGDSGYVSIGNLADDSTTYWDQATNTLQPDRVANYWNGYPAIDPDGVDDYLATTNASFIASDGFEWFAVIGDDYGIITGHTSSSTNYFQKISNNYTVRLSTGSQDFPITNTWPRVQDTIAIVNYQHNKVPSGDSTVTVWEGTHRSSTYSWDEAGAWLTATNGFSQLGRALNTYGSTKILAVVIYDTALSVNERAAVFNYLQDKYKVYDNIGFFVDATDGSNSNAGVSSATAWQTFPAEQTYFMYGDTIKFQAGETWATITLPQSGDTTNHKYMIVSSYDSGEKPVIQGIYTQGYTYWRFLSSVSALGNTIRLQGDWRRRFRGW